VRLLVEGCVDRAVVLFGSDSDPDPELTWARGVTLLAEDGTGATLDHAGPVGVVGTAIAGLDALAFAAHHPELVDRIVLVSTPIPDDDRALGFELSQITAKTLLLFGAKDPLTGSRHGTWWQKRLPNARLEVSPHGGHELLVPRWKRAPSHVAPHCKRSADGASSRPEQTGQLAAEGDAHPRRGDLIGSHVHQADRRIGKE
jgi:pimeloyl-ACP methyl ester carboxylesterase